MSGTFSNWLQQIWARKKDELLHPLTTRVVEKYGQPNRPRVYDPALQQCRMGIRLGDPVFDDPGKQLRFITARRRVVVHILRVVAESMWREHLMLRGSVLLKAWYPAQAREPGDADWVVMPKEWGMRDRQTRRMLDEVIHESCQRPCDEIMLSEHGVESDEIWTYARVPGLRFIVPWSLPGVAEDFVQMDFVFGENPVSPPAETEIPCTDGGSLRLLTASREQSLAWKLLWLETDVHPQGKDLYDAALLSEDAAITADLVDRTFQTAKERKPSTSWREFVEKLDIDWENFLQEYPWVEGDEAFWRGKLASNLVNAMGE